MLLDTNFSLLPSLSYVYRIAIVTINLINYICLILSLSYVFEIK